MKFTLFLLLLLSDVALSAQEVLLPFRENGLMGLKNPQERKVVEARYNSLHWQTDAYFTTVRKVWVSDTVEYEPGHVYILNDSINQSGLIYNGNEILKEEPFERYSILPGKCIIAHAAVNSHSLTRRQFKKYGLHRRFKALFDSHGNNLFPENFRHLEYLDTSGTHPRYKEQTRYVLIGFIEHDGSEGLLVVDAYKRIISQWLLRNEQDVRVKEGRMKGNGVVLSIKQRNGNSYNAMAKFDGKEYILSDMEVRDAVESVSEVHVKITDAESRVPVPEPPMEVSPRADDRVSLISYLQSGDSLMGTYSDGTRKLIQTVPGYKLLPVYARGSARGVPPLIFRSSAGRYAIFDSLNVKSVDYDQLFYAGKFILAQKQGLWGLLNAFGEPVVPILYDSITAIPFVYLNYSTSSPGTTVEVRSGKPSQSYSVYAKTLNLPVLAYAKGEATLLDGAGKRLLPGTYELIANNNLDFVQPAKTKFLIVRKSGKYGVVFPERLNSQTASQPPKVHWTHIPLSYVEDFYGIPGLRAFALFDEAFQLQEYVLEPGRF